jgi:hypothetical protein
MEFFEILRARVEDMVKDAPMTRRPSCGLPLALGAELSELCYAHKWLGPDDPPVGRLWAQWLDPRNQWRPAWAPNDHHVCCGFALQLGNKRGRGATLFRATKRHRNGEWAKSLWRSDMDEIVLRRLATFGDAPDTGIAEGARLLTICRCCFRVLTDPISIERGIGPECFGKADSLAEVYRQRQASADQFERVYRPERTNHAEP